MSGNVSGKLRSKEGEMPKRTRKSSVVYNYWPQYTYMATNKKSKQ
jgi:hypothetical protein